MSNIGVENFPQGFQYILSNNSLKIKDVRTGDQAEAWVRCFSSISNTSWVATASFPKPIESHKSYSFKRKYKCKQKAKNARKSRSKACQAKMVVKVWKKTQESSKESWPCSIDFQGVHNHEISVLPASQRYSQQERVLESTSQKERAQSDQNAGILKRKSESTSGEDVVQHAQDLLDGMLRKLKEELLKNPESMVPAVERMTKNFSSCLKNPLKLAQCVQKAFAEPLQPVKMPPNIPVQQSSVMRVSSMLCHQRDEKIVQYQCKDDTRVRQCKRVRFQSPESCKTPHDYSINRSYII